MASYGSPTFECYARNLRRIFWAEFIDVQTQMSRAPELRPPAFTAPDAGIESLSPTFEYHRTRIGAEKL
jgi:hypothetical protein